MTRLSTNLFSECTISKIRLLRQNKKTLKTVNDIACDTTFTYKHVCSCCNKYTLLSFNIYASRFVLVGQIIMITIITKVSTYWWQATRWVDFAAMGRQWDITVASTLAQSYTHASSSTSGNSAELATSRIKRLSTDDLPRATFFQPIALKTLGTCTMSNFICDVGRQLSADSGDIHETTSLKMK